MCRGSLKQVLGCPQFWKIADDFHKSDLMFLSLGGKR